MTGKSGFQEGYMSQNMKNGMPTPGQNQPSPLLDQGAFGKSNISPGQMLLSV